MADVGREGCADCEVVLLQGIVGEAVFGYDDDDVSLGQKDDDEADDGNDVDVIDEGVDGVGRTTGGVKLHGWGHCSTNSSSMSSSNVFSSVAGDEVSGFMFSSVSCNLHVFCRGNRREMCTIFTSFPSVATLQVTPLGCTETTVPGALQRGASLTESNLARSASVSLTRTF